MADKSAASIANQDEVAETKPSPTKEELFEEVYRRYDYGIDGWSYILEEYEKDMRFANGDQWPDSIRRDREKDDRPCLQDNRMPVFIRQIVGDIRQNKPRIKVSPVDDFADKKTAETIEGLIRNIEHTSKADIAYHTAGYNAAAGGLGYIHITREYNSYDVFEQDIKIKRILNTHAVVLDPSIEEPDGADAEWGFVSEWIPRNEFKERFPGKEPLDFEQVQVNSSYAQWVRENDVLIAAYYRKNKKKQTLIQLVNGHTMYKDEYEELISMLPPGMLPEEVAMYDIAREREVEVPYIKHYLLSGDDILEEPMEWPGQYIPIVPVFGEEVFVDGRRMLHSAIHFAKDNQRMLNYWRSAGTEHVALAPKAPWIATAAQIEGFEADYRDANKKNIAVLKYNPDAEAAGAPQRLMPPQASSGILSESNIAVEGIKATIGIFDASLGRGGPEQSGRAILARQREGDTATYTWIDNLALSIAQVGRVVLDLIPVVYDTQRLIRVRGLDDKVTDITINEQSEADNTILNNMTVGKYDVAVETGPSFTTQREEARETLMAMAQGNPAIFNMMGDIIAENMDFPGAELMGKRFKKTLPPGMLEPEEQEELMEGMPPQEPEPPSPEMMLEMEKLKVEAAKVEVDREKVEVDKMKIVGEKEELDERIRAVTIETLKEAHAGEELGE